MIIKGYDSIDELLQEETAEIEDYESAKEANDLLMDALKLTDTQKTVLRSSYEHLEELLINHVTADLECDKPKLIRIGSDIFQYDDRVFDAMRRIKGQELIDWIYRNRLEDVSIYNDGDCLYARMIDTENENHYKETCIRWDIRHAKYEVIDDILED